jgi:hypothetical protein
LGVLEEYCEAGNSGWTTGLCPWRWTTHSISVYNCDKKSGSYLLSENHHLQSGPIVQVVPGDSSTEERPTKSVEQQEDAEQSSALSNPKQLLLLPRRHSDLELYNPFFILFLFFSRVFVASCWSAQFDFGFLQIRPWKSYIYDLKSLEFEIKKLISLEVSFAFAVVMNISS